LEKLFFQVIPNGICTEMITVAEEFIQLSTKVLEQSFGQPFEVWWFDDHWSRLRVRPDAQHSPPSRQLVDLLNRASERDAVPFVEGNETSKTLLVPLRQRRTVTAVAVAQFETSASEWLVRMAKLAHQQIVLQTELQRTRDQTEAFAAETSQTYEELFLLRCLTEHLESSDVSQPATKLFDAVLPLVKDTILAESVLLIVPADDSALTHDPRRAKCELACGVGTPLESRLWRKLLRYCRSEAITTSFVNNRSDEIEEFIGSSQIRQMVLVPVASGGHWLGWVLAVNRQQLVEGKNCPGRLEFAQPEFGTVEAGLVSTAASILGTHLRNRILFRENDEMMTSAVRCLVSAIDAKDPYTRGHSERVGLYAECLGKQMGFDAKTCSQLYLSGLLHDIGKIGIRGSTLRKPGRLSEEEFEEIKQHPMRGWEILHELDKHGHLLEGVVHHHERFDGDGYPDGLAGEKIPLTCRILAVADTYDALTSDRAYRKGMPQEKAEEILRGGAGTQWDPAVIETCFEVMPEWIHIRETFQPTEPAQRHRATPEVPQAVTSESVDSTNATATF
jgi:HD-GYP domain-containing protein (c-di-GMP phosphodiesterase class II)